MMDELTLIEANDVRTRWAENGRPGMDGLGANWFEKQLYNITGDPTWVGGKPEMSAEEVTKAEEQASKAREKLGVGLPTTEESFRDLIRTPGIIPGDEADAPVKDEQKKEDKAVNDKKTEDAVAKGPPKTPQACAAVGGVWDPISYQCRSRGWFERPEAKKAIPWAIAGGLGLMILFMAIRRR